MKNTLLLCLLIFSITIVSSQEYKPFPTTNAAWKENHGYVWGSSLHESHNINHEIIGDTIINEKTYSKISKTGRNYYYDGSAGVDTIFSYDNVYVGAIREDTSKHVYFYGKYETQEKLLYDFNLEVGDTLPELYGADPDITFIVDSIDSVLVINEYHKSYIIVADWSDDFKLIEGIGSTCGLLTYGSFPGLYSTLKCFKQNGVSAYPSGEECELYTPLGINEKPDNIVAIYPNPTKGFVNFEFADLNIQQLTIYTITGETILEKSELQQNEIIDLSGQESGLYIVKIQSDSDVFISKMIKE